MWSTLPISRKRRRSSSRAPAETGSSAPESEGMLPTIQAQAARRGMSQRQRRSDGRSSTEARMRSPRYGEFRRWGREAGAGRARSLL